MSAIKQSPLNAYFARSGVTFRHVDGWRIATEEETGVAGVIMSDHSHLGWVRIEGRRAEDLIAAADCAPGHGLKNKYGWLFRLRPDLFFILTAADKNTGWTETLQELAATKTELITVTDSTHGFAKIRISGAESKTLLSRVCGLDFHDLKFPNQSIQRSSVAKTAQTILRLDENTAPSYLLLGNRSFAVYLWQTLVSAGGDLQMRAAGA